MIEVSLVSRQWSILCQQYRTMHTLWKMRLFLFAPSFRFWLRNTKKYYRQRKSYCFYFFFLSFLRRYGIIHWPFSYCLYPLKIDRSESNITKTPQMMERSFDIFCPEDTINFQHNRYLSFFLSDFIKVSSFILEWWIGSRYSRILICEWIW